jgi:hypothetical protein
MRGLLSALCTQSRDLRATGLRVSTSQDKVGQLRIHVESGLLVYELV